MTKIFKKPTLKTQRKFQSEKKNYSIEIIENKSFHYFSKTIISDCPIFLENNH